MEKDRLDDIVRRLRHAASTADESRRIRERDQAQSASERAAQEAARQRRLDEVEAQNYKQLNEIAKAFAVWAKAHGVPFDRTTGPFFWKTGYWVIKSVDMNPGYIMDPDSTSRLNFGRIISLEISEYGSVYGYEPGAGFTADAVALKIAAICRRYGIDPP